MPEKTINIDLEKAQQLAEKAKNVFSGIETQRPAATASGEGAADSAPEEQPAPEPVPPAAPSVPTPEHLQAERVNISFEDPGQTCEMLTKALAIMDTDQAELLSVRVPVDDKHVAALLPTILLNKDGQGRQTFVLGGDIKRASGEYLHDSKGEILAHLQRQGLSAKESRKHMPNDERVGMAILVDTDEACYEVFLPTDAYSNIELGMISEERHEGDASTPKGGVGISGNEDFTNKAADYVDVYSGLVAAYIASHKVPVPEIDVTIGLNELKYELGDRLGPELEWSLSDEETAEVEKRRQEGIKVGVPEATEVGESGLDVVEAQQEFAQRLKGIDSSKEGLLGVVGTDVKDGKVVAIYGSDGASPVYIGFRIDGDDLYIIPIGYEGAESFVRFNLPITETNNWKFSESATTFDITNIDPEIDTDIDQTTPVHTGHEVLIPRTTADGDTPFFGGGRIRINQVGDRYVFNRVWKGDNEKMSVRTLFINADATEPARIKQPAPARPPTPEPAQPEKDGWRERWNNNADIVRERIVGGINESMDRRLLASEMAVVLDNFTMITNPTDNERFATKRMARYILKVMIAGGFAAEEINEDEDTTLPMKNYLQLLGPDLQTTKIAGIYSVLLPACIRASRYLNPDNAMEEWAIRRNARFFSRRFMETFGELKEEATEGTTEETS